MGIAFRCDQCGKSYEVAEAHAGKKAKCKQCGRILLVPSPVGGDDDIALDDPYATEAEPEMVAPVSGDVGAAWRAAAEARARRPKPRPRDGLISLGRMPLWVLGAYLGAMAVLLLVALATSAEARLFAIFIGGFMGMAPFMLVGLQWRFGPAFREGFMVGILSIVVPFYRLYFWLSHGRSLAVQGLPPLSWRDLVPILFSLAFFAMIFDAAKDIDRINAQRRQAEARAGLGANFPANPLARLKGQANPRPRPRPRVDAEDQADPAPRPVVPKAPKRDRRPKPEAAPAPDAPPAVAQAPRPDPTPAPPSREEFFRGLADKVGEMADLLASVVDAPSAQAARPRFAELARSFDDDERTVNRLPLADPSAGDELAGVRAAADRYLAEAARVANLPNSGAILPRNVLEFRAFLPGTNIRLAVRPARNGPGVGRRPPMGPGLGQPPAPGASATVVVSGADDTDAPRRINASLIAILKAQGPNYSVRSSSSGGRSTFTVSPVPDPQALADKIDFGRVTKVEGSAIEVDYEPAKDPR